MLRLKIYKIESCKVENLEGRNYIMSTIYKVKNYKIQISKVEIRTVKMTLRYVSLKCFVCRTLNYDLKPRYIHLIRLGFNFIDVLRTAFTLVDPKSVKKIDNLTVSFTLLGSASVKAVRRTLMKLSLGRTLFCFLKPKQILYLLEDWVI